jgi:hypothetical protein
MLRKLLPIVPLLIAALVIYPARASEPQLLNVSFQSAALSQFFQNPVRMHAQVLLPDSYYKHPNERFPVIYVVPAFDGPYQINARTEVNWQAPSRELHRQFIVIFLEAMVQIDNEELHTQFADSANDGPWGTALTTDFIPATDAHFRTVAVQRTFSLRPLFGCMVGFVATSKLPGRLWRRVGGFARSR